MKYFTILLVLIGSISSVFAQSLHHRDKPLPCVNKTFAIYAHEVLDQDGVASVTEEQIVSILEGVNQAFAPICIRFELCHLDSIDNYNYDRYVRGDYKFPEMRRRFHVENRLNIFFSDEIRENVCGFAPINGISNADGAWLAIACPGAGTLIHELGHLFGLKHTFEGNGIELVDGSNCETEGDGICDTPADPYTPALADSIVYTVDCEFVYLGQDANGEFYQPDVGNYMSYYGCSCGFTYDQYLKMAQNFLNSNPKVW